MKRWEENSLEGQWLITLKVDGVNATVRNGGFVSRSGKPLYNANHLIEELCLDEEDTCELFTGSLEDTLSVVRSSKNTARELKPHHVFVLTPFIDARLYVAHVADPTSDVIQMCMDRAVRQGHEGLVLNGPTGERLKVKTVHTYDVIVTSIKEGKGRNTGRLGSLVTTKGAVSGMSDEQRVEFFTEDMVGKLVEVECMQLTPNGKFRHANFLRVRDDKPIEEAD